MRRAGPAPAAPAATRDAGPGGPGLRQQRVPGRDRRREPTAAASDPVIGSDGLPQMTWIGSAPASPAHPLPLPIAPALRCQPVRDANHIRAVSRTVRRVCPGPPPRPCEPARNKHRHRQGKGAIGGEITAMRRPPHYIQQPAHSGTCPVAAHSGHQPRRLPLPIGVSVTAIRSISRFPRSSLDA